MNFESTIDEKGRICIPAELRKKLNLKYGEKMIFYSEGDRIILMRAITPQEFIAKSKTFENHLKKVTNKSIPIEKLFE
jgi:AbrB family looped-hinge helix DNA binding protein